MRKYISLLFAVLILAACAKVPVASAPASGTEQQQPDEDTPVTPEEPTDPDEPGPDDPGSPDDPVTDITIRVTLPDIEQIETKTLLNEISEGGFRVSWCQGDAILVGGERFTLVSADGQTGTFSGKGAPGYKF